MTQQAVERALGKLLTDENFRDRFFTNPEITAWGGGVRHSITSSARPSAFQNFCNLLRRARIDLRCGRAVRHETASVDVKAERMHRGQVGLDGEVGELPIRIPVPFIFLSPSREARCVGRRLSFGA